MIEITTFGSFIELSRQKIGDFYWDMVQHQRLTFQVDGHAHKVGADIKCTGPYADILDAAVQQGMSTLVELYLSARLLVEGPKIYRPGEDDCAALEKVLPHLPIADYRQPFPVFAVELPERYSQAKQVGEARPLAIMTCPLPFAKPQAVMCSVLWSNNTAATRSFLEEGQEKNETLQSLLVRSRTCEWENALPSTDDENGVNESCIRLALNACLLLTHYGTKRVGAVNEKHERRLSSLLDKVRKRKEDTAPLTRQIKAIPVLYSFAQEVKLFRRTMRPSGREGEQTGRHVKPHWRAGHMRMQACGKGRLERRSVFICPVLVNAGDFHGRAMDTRTVYVDNELSSE